MHLNVSDEILWCGLLEHFEFRLIFRLSISKRILGHRYRCVFLLLGQC